MKIIAILSACLLMFFSHAAEAQNAKSVAVGARLSPDGGGFNIRYYPDKNIDFELQLNASGGYYNAADDGPSAIIAGLLEYNIIFRDPSWRLFLGPGLHAGSWERNTNNFYEYNRHSQAVFGIDGIFGVEYILKSVPVGFSLDVKPAMNFAADVAFFPNNMFGASARYYFSHTMLHKKRAAPGR